MVSGFFKAARESCRVDFEREVCFVIACIAFSSLTGKLHVHNAKYDKPVMEIGILSLRSESQIRRQG